MAIKTFTTGEVLTAADTNTYLANSGLVCISTTSLTGVTNTISNVFSTTYDAYRVVCTNINNASTTERTITLRFGTDATSNYDFWTQFMYGAGPTSGVAGTTNGTSATLFIMSQQSGQGFSMDIYNPFQAINTNYTHQATVYQSGVGGYIVRQGGGVHKVASSFTGFQINGQTDNLSGSVTVYGYRKA
jgi:hypothetical protein